MFRLKERILRLTEISEQLITVTGGTMRQALSRKRHWLNNNNNNNNVNFTLEQAMKTQKGSRGIDLLSNLGARWGGWSTPRPDRIALGRENQ